MKQLSQSQEEIASLKAKHTATSQQLEESQAINKTIEEKLASGEQNLTAQIDKNMALLEKLGDVDSTISTSRRRIRELEAELASLKENKAASSGLGASRWASADEGENAEDGGPATEGEDLGSSIEGTVGDPRLNPSYSPELPCFHPFT